MARPMVPLQSSRGLATTETGQPYPAPLKSRSFNLAVALRPRKRRCPEAMWNGPLGGYLASASKSLANPQGLMSKNSSKQFNQRQLSSASAEAQRVWLQRARGGGRAG